MDAKAENQTVIKYCERELKKIKKAREDNEEILDPGREKLLRDVIRDRTRSTRKENAEAN